MRKLRVLVVDDEPQMVGIIAYVLEQEGFEALTAYDGEQALLKVAGERPDIVVLDAVIPKIDGFEVCRRIRQQTAIPVIMLTVKREEVDRIRGLELGADDYVTKPFSHQELALRVKAVLRRTGMDRTQERIVSGELSIDFQRYQVTLCDQLVDLTPIEFRLLGCLASNAGRVLTWQALLKEVWSYEEWQAGPELVKVHIRRLRKKIELAPSGPRLILTVRGVGYRFCNQIVTEP
ncbi:MAG: DNA-binding response regulator [Chloroflexi bacterium HGW-Chloroflexi-1]|nr:MAG: DNA-binding response regulator [Chloroflexi bacterium HGW-Chloroflexi-1]